MESVLSDVTRGSLVEAVHEGSVAVVSTDGTLIAHAGDPSKRRYFRSSAKPFQSIPVVATGAADAFGLTSEELAIICASHNGTEEHQRLVASVLRKCGCRESHLQCGYSPPIDEAELARITLGLRQPNQIVCECSGEHAGMLAACSHLGWSTRAYTSPEHPLQVQVRAIIASACGLRARELEIGTDGCSIPTFGAPLQAFAFAYAVLADPIGARWTAPASWRAALIHLRAAMVTHPELISGAGETDTVIMQKTEGRVVAKLGAEGLLCLAVPERRIGIAISDAAGSSSSLGPAAVAVLEQLEIESADTIAALKDELCPSVETFDGKEVGVVRPVVRLESHSGPRESTFPPDDSPRADGASIQ